MITLPFPGLFQYQKGRDVGIWSLYQLVTEIQANSTLVSVHLPF